VKPVPVLFDVESRSRCDLKTTSGRRYWDHPSTEILCLSWFDVETGGHGTWLPGDDCPEALLRASRDGSTVAHNASNFDRFALPRVTGEPVTDWIDSSELARTAGLPAALGALHTRWGGAPKDKAASSFTTGLSTCRRPPGKTGTPSAVWNTLLPDEKRERGVQKDITPNTLARVVAYCESDVEVIRSAWSKLDEWRELEPDVVRLDRVMNDRGFGFDSELAKALLEYDAKNAEAVLQDVASRLGCASQDVRANVRSVPKFCALTGSPNAQRATVEALDHPLAEARLALATIAGGKLKAGLRWVSDDDSIRNALRYYGGHTGRWSAKGFQPHNMPRPCKRLEDMTNDEIHAMSLAIVSRRYHPDPEEIAMLVRACVVPSPGCRLVVSDFSGIEARITSWAAGDEEDLERFWQGVDPYRNMAAFIFGKDIEDIAKSGQERTLGKMAVLGCGFGMGGNQYAVTVGPRFDWSAVSVTPDGVVAAWRRLHHPIVRMWKALEKAFRLAIRDGACTKVGPFSIEPAPNGEDIWAFLPSGRPVVYPQAHMHANGDLEYLGNTKGVEHLYGGKITENLVQATARELLVEGMLRAESDGLRPVLTVHDEIICDVPKGCADEAYAELCRGMCCSQEWARGLPVAAKGFIGRRYQK
jgi:DNA polymerase